MKKLLLLLALIFVFVACDSDTTTETKKETNAETAAEVKTETQVETETETEVEAKVESQDNKLEIGKEYTLGDFKVVVKSFKLVKDDNDNYGLLMTYDAENVGEEKNTPGFALNLVAYQDNKETHDDLFMIDGVDYGIGQKTLKPGGKQEDIQEVVGVDDINKPIDLEFKETLTFSDFALKTTLETLSQYE